MNIGIHIFVSDISPIIYGFRTGMNISTGGFRGFHSRFRNQYTLKLMNYIGIRLNFKHIIKSKGGEVGQRSTMIIMNLFR